MGGQVRAVSLVLITLFGATVASAAVDVPLIDAVKEADLERVRSLLEQKVDVDLA